MSRRRWDVEPGPTELVPGASSSVLVSLHYLRSALRRRWRVWVGLGAAGFVVGIAATFLIPAASAGTTTVILAHDPGVEPSLAMGTDMRLLGTRTVAERVIDELGLDMTPEDFQSTVRADPLTSDVLKVTVYAADDAEALARATTLTTAFMDFRGDQIEAQSAALISGYEKRARMLQRRSDLLTDQYATVSSSPTDDTSRAADLLAQRAQTDEQIGQLQQRIAEVRLESGAIVEASHVLDPASIVPQSDRRRTALAGASGLIGGTAIGVGLVLVGAITSDRLRRREDVSRALGVPLRLGVGDIRAPRWAPWRRREAERALGLLAAGFESALLSEPERPVRMALAAVDNVDDATFLLAALGVRLHRRGVSVFLVDLSRAGGLRTVIERRTGAESRGEAGDAVEAVTSPAPVPSTAPPTDADQPDVGGALPPRFRNVAEARAGLVAHGFASEAEAEALQGKALKLAWDQARDALAARAADATTSGRDAEEASDLAVFRSDAMAELARGPLGTIRGLPTDLPRSDPQRELWQRAAMVLTLVEVAPDGGLDALASWADQAVPVVTTGRSSAERLQTTAELVRDAGLEMPFAVMVACDRTDNSLGSASVVEKRAAAARRTG